ncbi:MAG TPA: hydrogenase formation protein HypD [Gammaproteobacteria bacterium]|nr:hydrogenase isoenzymes formation protein HypD [bacterium BMS3Abin11]HDH15765.1 hydrogenase formation protein HypD [Gammaproteobacteria bacterium]HDZ78811.1 hydrogenase formation protein HypD [Gammaproteobacteria bacterium]
MSDKSKYWLDAIHEIATEQAFRIMNVCGGHERTISLAGIRSLLPKSIELIPGPGCPVCICPEEDIYQAMQLALHENITLLAFGDMLRVPVNTAKNQPRSLEQARSHGADVKPIASLLDVISIARANPQRKTVFFAAGFETTMAPVAAMMLEGIPDNLLLLLSGRLTWPAVAMLLQSQQAGFDALVAPGHVCATMGAEQWQFLIDDYQLPVAVAGFETESLLAAFYSVLRQYQGQRLFLDNCYSQVVLSAGNSCAQEYLQMAFDVVDSQWRGVGAIAVSGYQLKSSFTMHDARLQFPDYEVQNRRRRGEMPPGCDCAKVLLGKIYPDQCRLYGRACIPQHPVGPCMVSDEGACQIWWASGLRDNTPEQLAL